jgi:hypothetical protein
VAEGLSSAVSQDAVMADNPADSATAEVSSAAAGPLISTLSYAPGAPPVTSAASSAYGTVLARAIAAQRAEDFTRELGGLGASLTSSYTADGLDGRTSLSAAFVDYLIAGTAARTGVSASGGSAGSGGSPGGSQPIVPPPGPAPGGAFGGAAGAGSGAAVSGFPAFAGHLLLGAPMAMRRLRLSFQPWLTAFFVLIPERPG